MKIVNTPLSVTKYGPLGVVLIRNTTTFPDGKNHSRIVVNIEKAGADPNIGLDDLPALILLLQEISRSIILVRDLENVPTVPEAT